MTSKILVGKVKIEDGHDNTPENAALSYNHLRHIGGNSFCTASRRYGIIPGTGQPEKGLIRRNHLRKEQEMTRSFAVVLLVAMTLMSASCRLNQAINDKPVSHSFLCANYGGNMVRIVSRRGQIVWEHPATRPQGVWQLPRRPQYGQGREGI